MAFDNLTFIGSAMGGYGSTGAVQTTDAKVPAKPPLGSSDGGYGVTSEVGYGGVGWGYGFLNGYGDRPVSNLQTYFSCLLDPVVMAARAYAMNPIKSAKWQIASNADAPEGAADFIEKTMRPLISDYINAAVWAVDLGWAPFQNVFARRDGKYVITRIVPGRQEWSAVLVDPSSGDAVGVRWDGTDLLGHKAFFYTYDARGRIYIGRSRLENVINAVWNWRDDNDRAAILGKKASGIVAAISYPPGKGMDKNGAAVFRRDQADEMGKIITSGAGFVTFPSLATQAEDAMRTSKPSDAIAVNKASAWNVSMLNLGDTGTAQDGLTKRQRYLDELKCLALYVPPESVLQGMGGNRAKSDAQGDSGTAMQEPVNQGVCKAFCKGPVDSVLELNYGAGARGTVWFTSPSLTDSQGSTDQLLMQAAMAGPNSAYYNKNLDVVSVFVRNGVNKLETPLTDEEMPSAKPAASPPSQPDGTPKLNGNGINGRLNSAA